MKPVEFGRAILKESRRRDDGLLKYYVKNYKQISESISQHPGLKADVKLIADDHYYDRIRFASLMNDFTTLALPPAGEMILRLPQKGKDIKEFIGSEIKFSIETKNPDKYVARDGKANAIPVFAMPSDRKARETVEAIAPLIMRGRAIVRPQRCIISLEGELPSGNKAWNMVEIDQTSPHDLWRARDFSDQSMPIVDRSSNDDSEVNLYNITLPFLSGINFSDLATLLDEEEHHLAKTRVALRDVVEEARKAGRDLTSVVNDILRPEIDSLTLKLKAASKSRYLKQGAATLGMVTMGLTAIFTGGLPQVAAAVAGAGGGGLLAKEIAEGIEKKAALESGPFYLVWRLRKIQSAA
ncbi:hypothetical protein P9273_20155 [Mesorhizobium sp. WSM4935]|uniref:hypothetical protein n=1 Tax=Mesorhizobium sp. WSM4935 TaxID=3038547 RepID=UPI00241569BC|nr:hypothetical protein [Mesorhizobium sp. WSM4935]MDG4877415.1 hypothetical protein [Mesorhizobium sp. WSM4935]